MSNASLLKWDKYFFDIASAVGRNSSCLSRQIGCLLVKDKTIICEGYNGPPRGVPHCDERYQIDTEMRKYLEAKNINPDDEMNTKKCPRYTMGYKSGQGLQWCIAGHAERNALINAARMGIKTNKCTLYMDCGIPCTPCLVEIINAGIKEIVITKYAFYDISAKYLLEHSDLKFRLYSHLCEHKNVSEELLCSDCGFDLTEDKE